VIRQHLHRDRVKDRRHERIDRRQHDRFGRDAAQFRRAFGASVFADRRRAFKAVLLALETFEESPADFYPYSSKYDAFLRGTAALSAAELVEVEAPDAGVIVDIDTPTDLAAARQSGSDDF